MKLKLSHLMSSCHTRNRSQLELITDSQISLFPDIFGENLPKFNTNYREIYYVGNFNLYLGDLNPLLTTKT